MSDNRVAVMNLRVIAALAEKLAADLEGNRLWEGEFSAGLVQIQKAMRDIPSIR